MKIHRYNKNNYLQNGQYLFHSTRWLFQHFFHSFIFYWIYRIETEESAALDSGQTILWYLSWNYVYFFSPQCQVPIIFLVPSVQIDTWYLILYNPRFIGRCTGKASDCQLVLQLDFLITNITTNNIFRLCAKKNFALDC